MVLGLGTGSTAGFVIAPLAARIDRKSTRLNSSHLRISYAVFCLQNTPEDVPRQGRVPVQVHEHRRVGADRHEARGRERELAGVENVFFLNDTGPPEPYPFPHQALLRS